MKGEYAALFCNDTWDLVELPMRMRAIGTKWVFKTKRNADGTVGRYKACVVAKGFAQRKGIDFDDIHSSGKDDQHACYSRHRCT
jgi:Reverse transcriptase (RNA-dependent DNA polymerase)